MFPFLIPFILPVAGAAVGVGLVKANGWANKQKFTKALLKVGPNIAKIYDVIDPILATNLAKWNGSQVDKAFDITNGPFAGMSYEIETLSWFDSYESLVQKKYGIYEQEVLSYISENTWSTLIDIGAGTGYYSLGMLRLRYCKKAILFESNEEYFPIIRRNASANSIDESRFQINGTADAAVIISKLNEQNTFENSSTLIICDIEGFENKFFVKQ